MTTRRLICLLALVTLAGCGDPEGPNDTSPDKAVAEQPDTERKGTLEDLLTKMDPEDSDRLKAYLEKVNKTPVPDETMPGTDGPQHPPLPDDPTESRPKVPFDLGKRTGDDTPPGEDPSPEPPETDPIVDPEPERPEKPDEPDDPTDLRLSKLIETMESMQRLTADQQQLLSTLKLIRSNLKRGRPPVPPEFPNAGADPFYFAWRNMGNAFNSRQFDRALESARTVLDILRTRNDLEVRRPVLASAINGYGNYERIPNQSITRPGLALLYFEVENFGYKEVGDKWEVKIRLQVQLLDIGGRNVKTFDFKPVPLQSLNRVRDYYQSTRLAFPRELPRGPYILKIIIEDMHAGKTTEERIEMELK
ncbi:MAG: hypothetical protein ACOCXX_02795 [Planctomycetota bacterium]